VRRRLLALTVVSALFFVTAACGGGSGSTPGTGTSSAASSGPIAGVTVSGAVGSTPKVSIKTPLKVSNTQTQVLTKGSGPALGDGQHALLHLYLASGTTGQKIGSTYDQGTPQDLTFSTSLPPALVTGLNGRTAGSRILVAAPVSQVYSGTPPSGIRASDSLVLVLDLVSVQPTNVLKAPQGAQQSLPSGLPTLVQKGTSIQNLDFSKAPKKPSGGLKVVTLVKGTGPVVKAPSLITVNYIGQKYGAAKPFNNSYTATPTTFGVGVHGLIPAWDQALVGMHVGSRVMLVVPPSLGYGSQGNSQIQIGPKDYMVFVIDILGAS
jgi:peptidylprolyl isomerase